MTTDIQSWRTLHFRIVFHAATLMALVVLGGCEEQKLDSNTSPKVQTVAAVAERPARENQQFNFGVVSLDRGPSHVSHDFELGNPTSEPLEIKDIARTCGCVACKVQDHVIAPGSSTIVTVSMDVKSSGFVNHGATLICSDEIPRSFNVSAVGVFSVECYALSDWPECPTATRLMPIHVYSVDSTRVGEYESPRLLAPEGAGFQFDGWKTIESGKDFTHRPFRQIAECFVDFTSYQGSFPVEIRLETARGHQCVLMVYDSDLSD